MQDLSHGESASTQAVETVTVRDKELEMVHSFCYLVDMIDNTVGCANAITSCVCGAWKKFRAIPLAVLGHVYSAADRSVLLYTSETWPFTSEGIARISCIDNAMVSWIAPKS